MQLQNHIAYSAKVQRRTFMVAFPPKKRVGLSLLAFFFAKNNKKSAQTCRSIPIAALINNS